MATGHDQRAGSGGAGKARPDSRNGSFARTPAGRGGSAGPGGAFAQDAGNATFSGKKGGLGMGGYVGHGYTQRQRSGLPRSDAHGSSSPGHPASRSGRWDARDAGHPDERRPRRAQHPAASPGAVADRVRPPVRRVTDAPPKPARTPRREARGRTRGKQPMGQAKAVRKRTPCARAFVVIAVLAVVALLYCIDGGLNFGKIHAGVTVGGLDVGGMTVEQAAQLIDERYSPLIMQGDITMFASQDAADAAQGGRQQGAQSDTQQAGDAAEPVEISFDYDALQALNDNPPKGPVFEVSPSTLGARIDAQALAQQAYDVGRGADFVLGRLRAALFGVSIGVEPTLDDTAVETVESILTNCLGTPMRSPGIAYADGAFGATKGCDGYMVSSDEFVELVSDALMSDAQSGEDRSLVVPMSDVAMTGTDASAEKAAQAAQDAIAQPVELVCEDRSVTLDADAIATLISTFVEDNQVVPYVSLGQIEAVVPTLEGFADVGTPAQNVRYSYDGQKLSYTEATTGIGPDYAAAANGLNAMLFGDAALNERAGEVSRQADDQEQAAEAAAQPAGERTIVMELTTSYPTMTHDDAQALGLESSLITSYSTSYEGGSDAKITNICLLADILTNTVVAPGQVFSINGIAGECNAEKGFKEGGAIVDGEITSEVGGGICQVATTIFNAVLQAGYEVVERHNHSNYMESYPDGQDAAISWDYLDLKFRNNTDNYLLVLLDHDETSVTCSLWGIDPGFYAKTEIVDWQPGEHYTTKVVVDPELAPGTQNFDVAGQDGHITVLERTIYSKADDSVLGTDSFTSVYQPKKRIVTVGPDTTPDLGEDAPEG